MGENKTCLILVDKDREEVTEEELKEVLQNSDGDLERLEDFKDTKLVWGYISRILDYHRCYLLDMDKVILFIDENDDAYGYEHTGNYSPEHKEGKEVIGLIDENAEIESI
jgi:hypothetical protein|tara:strand:+ start:122 stop:451 length:330 start_codon:yes stop_codon:yes gene_type:complete